MQHPFRGRPTLKLKPKQLAKVPRVRVGKPLIRQPRAAGGEVIQEIEKLQPNGTVTVEQEYKTPNGSSRVAGTAGLGMGMASAPLAIAPMMPAVRAPRMRNTARGVVVSHHEYVGDLNGHFFYNIDRYNVTPGNPDIFPWLSRMAPRYEQYHFHRLNFSLLPSTAATGDGMKGLMLDYDVNDPAPTTKAELLNSYGAVRANSWMPATMRAPVTALNQIHWRNVGRGFQLNSENSTRYVRAALEDDQLQDQRLESVGMLNVSTVGYGDVSNTVKEAAMELWVEYEIEFRINQAGADAIRSANVRTTITDSPAITTAVPYGTTDFGWSSLPGGLSVYNAYTAAIQQGFAPQASYGYLGFSAPGHYLVLIRADSNIQAGTFPTIVAKGSSTGNLRVTTTYITGGNTSTTTAHFAYLVLVEDTNNFCVLDWSPVFSGAPSAWNIWAAEVAPGSIVAASNVPA
jgi:hypothetical protein